MEAHSSHFEATSLSKQPNRLATPQADRKWIASAVVIALWLLAVAILSSRIYFLLPYAVVGDLPPSLEPFGIPAATIPICVGMAIAWCWLANQSTRPSRAIIYLLIASAPLLLWFPNAMAVFNCKPNLGENIWLAGWTGLSFSELLTAQNLTSLRRRWSAQRILKESAVLWIAIVTCTVWWFCQLSWYHDNFLLGYNDYGHFLQRLSNTLHGHGWLIESPILPRFWDHFNPGLLLLLPAWAIWPDVHQAFAWQASALAICAHLVFRIALALGHRPAVAMFFGLAWLAQPSVGQMNLGYTYGWHPITLAIPLLLATIWSLLANRRWLALIACLLALSMEEGVFVVVALTALCCAVYSSLSQWRTTQATDASSKRPTEFHTTLPAWAWWGIGIASAIGFVLVYKFSGLAEFQTGRFIKLGNSPREILLSPFLRPSVFWGSLVASDRWVYMLLLWMPCGVPSLWRGWRYLVPTLFPLFVLAVWDHLAAHCIAFQYASTLLPLFWLAALSGAQRADSQEAVESISSHPPEHTLSGIRCAVAAMVTGTTLSIFLGQLPFSTWTLLDVDSRTYGAGEVLRRHVADDDGAWLNAQLLKLRQQRPRCLATGRIAAHLVGMPDIETVGQYAERRERLRGLSDRPIPIRHYDWLVLDHHEIFQQTSDQIKAVEAEALAEHFEVVARQYDIVILKRVD